MFITLNDKSELLHVCWGLSELNNGTVTAIFLYLLAVILHEPQFL